MGVGPGGVVWGGGGTRGDADDGVVNQLAVMHTKGMLGCLAVAFFCFMYFMHSNSVPTDPVFF